MNERTAEDVSVKHWRDRGYQDAVNARSMFCYRMQNGGIFWHAEPPSDVDDSWCELVLRAYTLGYQMGEH